MFINNRIPQGLIFCGDDFLGKRKMAFDFVEFLNCQMPDFSKRPCGKCTSCSLIIKQKHPDIYFIEPQKKEIQISQVRNLQKQLLLKNQVSQFRCFIINQADSLNILAQNCFLKTLEEPQGKTVFILITSKPEMLLETIRSRCQIVKFYPQNEKIIRNCLNMFAKEPDFEKVILVAQGRPSLALELLENRKALQDLLVNFKKLSKLLKSTLAERFLFVKNFLENKEKEDGLILENFLGFLTIYLRLMLLEGLGLKNGLAGLAFCLVDYSLTELAQAIKEAEKMRILVSTANINQKLALETLLTKLLVINN